MKKRKVIIDCDPGIDDSLAIMLALKSPEIEVIGITIVCGNSPVEMGFGNAKKILKLIETVNQKYENTIVMVTHNDAIKDMADRVVKLRDGMIRKNYMNEHKIPAAELDW